MMVNKRAVISSSLGFCLDSTFTNSTTFVQNRDKGE